MFWVLIISSFQFHNLDHARHSVTRTKTVLNFLPNFHGTIKGTHLFKSHGGLIALLPK
mgnify:CR=1 FL=1